MNGADWDEATSAVKIEVQLQLAIPVMEGIRISHICRIFEEILLNDMSKLSRFSLVISNL
jgi:hypothetical protein